MKSAAFDADAPGMLPEAAGSKRGPLSWAAVLTLLLILGWILPDTRFFSDPRSYLPLHTALETISIAVSAMVVALTWNLRDSGENRPSFFIGAVFLYVALMDFAHTLSYQGMPDWITPSGPEKAIYFWLCGRLAAASGLLGLALLPRRPWSIAGCWSALGLALAAAAACAWVGLFHADLLPRTFVANQGLTPFKIGAEYFLAAILFAAALAWYRDARRTGSEKSAWIAAASWILGLSGMFFTLYKDVTDLFNLLGHIYKLSACWMIYRAIFAAGVQAPFRALQAQETRLQELVDTRTREVLNSQVQQRALIEMSPTAMAMFDRQMNYLAVSALWKIDFSFGHEALLGKNHYLVWPGHESEWHAAQQAVLAGETVGKDADCLRLPGDRVLWLRWAAYPWRREDGEIGGAIIYAEDITAYKQAESVLQEQRERLRLALNAGKSGTFEWDAASGQTRWSDELLELYGLRRDEYHGRYQEWLDCLLPDDREGADRAAREALKTGSLDIDFRIRHRKSGELRWLGARAKVYFDADGRAERMFGIDIDITDRKRAEEHLLLALDAARMIGFEYDMASSRVKRQGSTARELGLSLDDSGEDFFSRIHPDDLPVFQATLRSRTPERPEYDLRYRIRMPDGRYRWMADHARVLFEAGRQATGVQGIVMDVEEQRQAEISLAHERELLAAIVDNIPVMLCVYDSSLQRFSLNRHAEKILGWTTDEANDGGFLAKVYPDPVYRETISEHMRQLAPGWREFQVTTRDGSLIPSEWANIALPDQTHIGIGIDVRERKAAAAQLATHAQRQALLLEVASGILGEWGSKPDMARSVFRRVSAHLDADVCFNYRILPEGEAMELVAGFGIPDGLQQAAQTLRIGQAFCGTVAATRQPLIADAGRIATDEQGAFVRRMGVRAYACHPLYGLNGEVIGTFSLASTRRDHFDEEEVEFIQTIAYLLSLAWERRRAEQEIQRLNADLEHRVETRTAELLRSNLALQRFAYVAAHDLQTPLRSIASFVQLLDRHCSGALDGQARQYMRFVTDNTQRMQLLISDLLAYARLDSQARPAELTDMRRLADDVLASMAATLEESGAVVTCGELPTLAVDRMQMAQVFVNLIGNGIKYNHSRPIAIHIAAEHGRGEWLFAVRDNGIGIDPRYHAQIFEPFKRLHSYQAYPGSGVGLAICRGVVERHGGRLWVESAEGQGSTFYFTLPDSEQPHNETQHP